MKRIVQAGIAAVLAALIVAPLGFSAAHGGLRVSGNAASALPAPEPGGGGGTGTAPGTSVSAAPKPFTNADDCVQIGLPIAPDAPAGSTCTIDGQPGIVNNAGGGAIVNYLRGWLKLLSEAVSLVVMLMIVIAGIQYITSVGNPSQVKSAKDRLINAILALILFLLMFAILQFLIPGGIL